MSNPRTPAPVTSEDHFGASVRIDGSFAVIRIPLREIHGLRVALEPCPCRASKSASSQSIRSRFSAALGKLGV